MRTLATTERQDPEAKRPAWLTESIFPFESRFLTLANARVHYVDEGQGPVLLFVHSAPSSSFLYRAFIRDLRSDYRCIALDNPGFGLSSTVGDYPISLARLSADVARFVEALDLRDITMIVHDSGGPIGLAAAARMPERYTAFVITDTLAFPLTSYPLVQLMLRLVTSSVFRAWNRRSNILPRMVSTLAPVGRRLSWEEREVYRSLFPTPEARDRILLLMRELIDQPRFLSTLETDLRTHFRDRPTLLMYGQFDPTRLVGWMNRFRDIFPMHRARVVPREGHFPHEGAPQFMIREIRRWYEDIVANSEASRDGQAHAYGEKAHRAHP